MQQESCQGMPHWGSRSPRPDIAGAGVGGPCTSAAVSGAAVEARGPLVHLSGARDCKLLSLRNSSDHESITGSLKEWEPMGTDHGFQFAWSPGRLATACGRAEGRRKTKYRGLSPIILFPPLRGGARSLRPTAPTRCRDGCERSRSPRAAAQTGSRARHDWNR